MQTHQDNDHEGPLARALRAEAEKMTAERSNTMTAEGTPLREWEKNGVHVTELPRREVDEGLAITRVSLGASASTTEIAYLVFRGPVKEVKYILRRALNALQHKPRGGL